jgi:hypothetical protein
MPFTCVVFTCRIPSLAPVVTRGQCPTRARSARVAGISTRACRPLHTAPPYATAIPAAITLYRSTWGALRAELTTITRNSCSAGFGRGAYRSHSVSVPPARNSRSSSRVYLCLHVGFNDLPSTVLAIPGMSPATSRITAEPSTSSGAAVSDASRRHSSRSAGTHVPNNVCVLHVLLPVEPVTPSPNTPQDAANSAVQQCFSFHSGTAASREASPASPRHPSSPDPPYIYTFHTAASPPFHRRSS